MANKKNLTSKNLAMIIEDLLKQGKESLAMQILETSKFSRFANSIKHSLKRRADKITDFNKTKIYSNDELSKSAMDQIQQSTKIDLKSASIIIDKTYSPGVVVQSGSRKIDATLSTMLSSALQK